jgi:amyloid beta precursor protein binding protein 1
MTTSPGAGGAPGQQPDANAKRYDRQLRIWGAEGQQRLESAKIALLNAGPTGSETLKNLVLGGIGSFTIVDGAKVSAADLGNNFLVEAASLGQSRAKCVTALVQELNETVAGSYVEEAPEALIGTNPKFFDDFTLIIATQVGGLELRVRRARP